jgi:hypothetical protein
VVVQRAAWKGQLLAERKTQCPRLNSICLRAKLCILDFIQENTSDIQPDTIHADTQGQSAAIFQS